MVKMLLRDVAMSDLAEIYERNADRSQRRGYYAFGSGYTGYIRGQAV